MLDNYESIIIGCNDCILVPYRIEHVLNYHNWMMDPLLLQLTSSEPLSLDEEYTMQQTWKNDINKCTFIILSKTKVLQILYNIINNHNHTTSTSYQQQSAVVEEPDITDTDTKSTVESHSPLHNSNKYDNETIQYIQSLIVEIQNTNTGTCNTTNSSTTGSTTISSIPMNKFHFIQETISAMIGDVNLFISDVIDTDSDSDNDIDNDIDNLATNINNNIDNNNNNNYTYKQAEVDIMIAEKDYRNKGLATEAVLLIMYYYTTYCCKITNNNNNNKLQTESNNNINHNNATSGSSYNNNNKTLIQRYFCKIHETNIQSTKLFVNKLLFQQCNYTQCFHEYEYELQLNSVENTTGSNTDTDTNHPSVSSLSYNKYKLLQQHLSNQLFILSNKSLDNSIQSQQQQDQDQQQQSTERNYKIVKNTSTSSTAYHSTTIPANGSTKDTTTTTATTTTTTTNTAINNDTNLYQLKIIHCPE